jgi:molecular chaperone GrpE
MSDPTPAGDAGTGDVDDERGSEVDDYTGEVPRIDVPDDLSGLDATAFGGFGDGDVADVDEEFDAAGDTVEQDIDGLRAEVEALTDRHMRLQADFENYRKRSVAEKAAEVDRATGRLAEAFLPVLDATEAAYLQHPDEVGPLLNVLLTELKKLGLESLDLERTPFDPEVAEAVAHEPGSGGDVVVAEVLRSGYRWKGRTLRPAMVRTKD